MGGEGQVLKRIPRIKFPQRHPKPSSSGTTPEAQRATSKFTYKMPTPKSDVPLPPQNTAVGGKASLQPKRTPVTDREIEAVLLGGCFD
ncbi:uncharacterized protein LOC112092373 [Morus notabilis]|uniref:uncharacterized protein LOC112092373 n=1 Tax=Morus notabilis TaxID=981085 RepID=UPI000CED6115|nr:uncharacterized protein LOC112092373 [Morus notabilis]